MLQVELKTYASDALEDAMRLAQTKALNSYSWSDMLSALNYTWSDLYNRVTMIDSGYYSTTVRLNTEMTTIPPFVKNTVLVYAAQEPIGFNREVFRASGMNDMRSRSTYYLSGNDLYCPDAVRRTVWLNFAPSPPMLFFTRNNRDPKLYEEDPVFNTWLSSPQLSQYQDYGLYRLQYIEGKLVLVHKNPTVIDTFVVTRHLDLNEYNLQFIYCDYPYIFITYKHKYMDNTFKSGFFKDIIHNRDFTVYNPFDFAGRDSNVEYLYVKWNDKTGLSAVVRDHNDYDTKERRFRVKELGWTPDTVLTYPCPEMYRYLVARLAEKLAAFNESEIMGVQRELVDAKYAFEAFCAKDKSSWQRIVNVNGPSIGDWL